MGRFDASGDCGQRSPSNMTVPDFSPDNLMEEIDGDGWLNTTKPEGSARLNKLHTIGGRGMELKDLRTRSRVDTGD